MCVKLTLANFQQSSLRGTLSNWALNKGDTKNLRFSTKSGHILKMV